MQLRSNLSKNRNSDIRWVEQSFLREQRAASRSVNLRTNGPTLHGEGRGLGMLITDQHTSLFPPSPYRLIVWRAGGVQSLVLSHRLARLPADSSWNGPSPVSLHAGLAWDRRVDPTTRSREESSFCPLSIFPCCLHRSTDTLHDVSTPQPPSTYHHHR